MYSLIVGAKIRRREMGNRRVRWEQGRKNGSKTLQKRKTVQKRGGGLFASLRKTLEKRSFPQKIGSGVPPCSQKKVWKNESTTEKRSKNAIRPQRETPYLLLSSSP
jgi:hypothetical protein